MDYSLDRFTSFAQTKWLYEPQGLISEIVNPCSRVREQGVVPLIRVLTGVGYRCGDNPNQLSLPPLS